MQYTEIIYSVDNKVLTITLNRPDKLNAFTRTMFLELLRALDQADADDTDRAIIFTGASADAREGIQAFLEKRAPNFTMSAARDMPSFYPWWHEPEFKV